MFFDVFDSKVIESRLCDVLIHGDTVSIRDDTYIKEKAICAGIIVRIVDVKILPLQFNFSKDQIFGGPL